MNQTGADAGVWTDGMWFLLTRAGRQLNHTAEVAERKVSHVGAYRVVGCSPASHRSDELSRRSKTEVIWLISRTPIEILCTFAWRRKPKSKHEEESFLD